MAKYRIRWSLFGSAYVTSGQDIDEDGGYEAIESEFFALLANNQGSGPETIGDGDTDGYVVEAIDSVG